MDMKELSNDILEFLKMSRELLDYCSCMEMATKYKPREFNYSEYRHLLHNTVKEIVKKEDVDKVYNHEIRYK